MRNVIFIFAALFVIGCSDTPFKVDNQKAKTTQEILDLVKDSTSATYHLVTLDETVYAVNNETRLVEYKYNNYSGGLSTCLIVIVILFVIIVTIANFLTD